MSNPKYCKTFTNESEAYDFIMKLRDQGFHFTITTQITKLIQLSWQETKPDFTLTEEIFSVEDMEEYKRYIDPNYDDTIN